ncbi:hypothetical protein BDW62DRAFT_216099 [Aspergillus aurantiobrunneus]
MEQSSPAATVSTTGACQNCREKHLKCDGNLAGCSRCSNLRLFCHYVPSRRGRRAQLAPMADYPIPPVVDVLASPSLALGTFSPSCLLDPPPVPSRASSHLVAIYYLHFHPAHPFLPPHHVLTQSAPPSFVLDLIEFISLHYLPSHVVTDCTGDLRAAVQDAEPSLEKAQAYLLLSIIQHARQQPRDAKECLAEAIRCSVEIGLHCREFADVLEMQNPVRAESARRTCWEIFTIDALLAAVQFQGALQFNLDTPDVLLPCEEDRYNENRLPGTARTVGDLGIDGMFSEPEDLSSFAYRIEAAIILRRCFLASETQMLQDSLHALDATISAWFHRLPSWKRAVLQPNGELNELDFQATMIMHCASIYLHFPKSCLPRFLPHMSQIFCSGPPAFESTSAFPQIHTAKVVAAAVNLSKLASLSTSVMNHSPFFACTLVLSSVIQLAVLTTHTQQLASHRPFLTLNMGVLKSMGDIWTIAATSKERLREVALEVEAAFSGRPRGLLESQWILSV